MNAVRTMTGQCIPGRVEIEDLAAPSLFLASNNTRHISGGACIVDSDWYRA